MMARSGLVMTFMQYLADLSLGEARPAKLKLPARVVLYSVRLVILGKMHWCNEM